MIKRKIRKGTFETNSSSTHAICVPKPKFEPDYPLATWVDVVEFKFGEFGWEECFYGNYEEKANYLYTAMQYSITLASKAAFKNACDFIKETLEKYDLSCTFQAPTLTEGYNDENGYIDHGEELPEEFVKNCTTDEDFLMRYLFGNSIVITGTDNGDSFWKLFELLDLKNCDTYYKGN